MALSTSHRFYSSWYYIKRDHPNGQRCRCKKGDRSELLTPYSVRYRLDHVLHDRNPQTLPPRHSNVYGIDMPSRLELVAYNRTTEAIAEAIGADLVIFQTLPDLISSVRQFNPSITTFDCSVFTGEYVTGGVDEEYLARLESTRADNVKDKAELDGLGPLEGKGGGAVGDAGDVKRKALGRSGPMNGANDTIGLHNDWKPSRH